MARGQPRKYEETLSCEVRIYFTRSQYDTLLSAVGSSQSASAFLRDMFLSSLDTTHPVNSPLINLPDCLDNEGDG